MKTKNTGAAKPTHTPGPWKMIEGMTAERVPLFYVAAENRGVATLMIEERDSRFHTEHTEANARLIAAAPDLLSKLKMAEDAMEAALFVVEAAVKAKAVTFDSVDNPSVNLKYQINSVRAAIAKAEGK